MNIIKSFNSTIDYLETVLDDEIDEKKVTRISGYSYSMFSRLFSILTEMTLSEYLRSRRLTEAAIILRDTDEKLLMLHSNLDMSHQIRLGLLLRIFMDLLLLR